MEPDQIDKMRERIHKKAIACAEAQVYSIDNPYLSRADKVEVELWYQFPMHVSLITMLACLVYSSYYPLSWYWIVGIPLIANCIFGILNWANYNRKFLFGIYLSVCHHWSLWLLTLVSIVLMVVNGAYTKAVIAICLQLFLIVFVTPHILIYSILSRRYQMHPKYAFFKRVYGYEFPFEKDLKDEIV
jgi:hypothetical protein